MKKFLSLLLSIITAISCTAFASDGNRIGVIDPVALPETYIEKDSVELFAPSKTLEEVLLEGWSNLDEYIPINSFNYNAADADTGTSSDIGYVYRGILLKNPEVYYVANGFRYSYNSFGKIIGIYPIYTVTDRDEIADTLAAIGEATEEVLLGIDETMTDFEKIMTVHDYMVLNYDYDYTYSTYDLTIMTKRTGVCQSYALAFKHLMNKLGIECVYVSASESMNHAWNLVKLGDFWYHIDLTWDDPGTTFGQVRHTYALLSDYEIQNLPKPHFGYDSKGLTADSDLYDKNPWHSGVGSIVSIDGTSYWVDGTNLVDEHGNVIFKNLDGGDGTWSIGNYYYFFNSVYAGLTEHNRILYFNSDKAIYSYDPKTQKTKKLLTYDGACGLFTDRNTLRYCKYDLSSESFVSAGKINLGNIRYGGTNHEAGKLVKRVYKESDDSLFVYSFSGRDVETREIVKKGLSKISFDELDSQTLFFWDKNMKPVKEKEIHIKQ